MEKTVRLEILKKLQCTDKTYRQLLVVLATCCVLISIGVWNSFEFSWMTKRLSVHQKMIEWHGFIIDDGFNPDTCKLITNKDEFEYCKRHYFEKGYSKESLLQVHNNLNRLYNEHYLTMKVPFFGVSFDINDLSIFGGIAFCMISYLLLYYANLRKNHLRIAIKTVEQIKDDDDLKRDCFNLICMFQTFTKSAKKNNNSIKIVTAISRNIYWIPVVILLGVLVYDGYTYRNGTEMLNSPIRTSLSLTIGVVFELLLIIIVLGVRRSINKYNRLWRKVKTKIK